jgi:hypothetical protein
MKKLIEDGLLEINDEETIKELCAFTESNGKYFGEDYHDDLVSALYWALYIFELNILDESSVRGEKKVSEDKSNDEDMWGIISEVDRPDEDFAWMFERS